MVSFSHADTANSWRLDRRFLEKVTQEFLWRRMCLLFLPGLVERESWGCTDAAKVYRKDEEEEREDGESQKERVNTETHSRLVSHLFTVYKDISAWQGAMPNNGIHQSWASSKPSEIHPPPSPPLAYKNGHGIPAKVTCKAFKLAIPSHTLPHHLKWLRCS